MEDEITFSLSVMGPAKQCLQLSKKLASFVDPTGSYIKVSKWKSSGMVDSISLYTPTRGKKILMMDFNGLEKIEYGDVPLPYQSQLLSEQYPEVLLTIGMDSRSGAVRTNFFNGKIMTVVKDRKLLLTQLLKHWDAGR